ncbi:uncharacterized protein LOC144747755 [Ciona intestinalis]
MTPCLINLWIVFKIDLVQIPNQTMKIFEAIVTAWKPDTEVSATTDALAINTINSLRCFTCKLKMNKLLLFALVLGLLCLIDEGESIFWRRRRRFRRRRRRYCWRRRRFGDNGVDESTEVEDAEIEPEEKLDFDNE